VRFASREDFWIIVAARSEDETEIGAGKAAGRKRDQDIRRATRRHFSAEEKIRVVLEGLRGEERIAELCWKLGAGLTGPAAGGIRSSTQQRDCARRGYSREVSE
jgi:hypothetical protein